MPAIPTYALYGESGSTGWPSRFEALHCESIASRSRLHDWEIKPHRHEAFFQILYLRRGSGRARFEDRIVPIVPPCVLTVPALTVHGFVFSRDVDGIVITVFDRLLAALFAEAPGLLEQLTSAQCHRYEAGSMLARDFQYLFDRFESEFEGAAPWRGAAIRASLAAALVQLARALAQPDQPAAEPADRQAQRLQKFRSMVDREFRQRHGVAWYADRIGISATHLNRLCRQTMGRSALGVINSRILLEAERDLIYTALGIKAIALSLGFSDAAYFTRFFAKHARRTPTEFRRDAHRQLTRDRTAERPIIAA